MERQAFRLHVMKRNTTWQDKVCPIWEVAAPWSNRSGGPTQSRILCQETCKPLPTRSHAPWPSTTVNHRSGVEEAFMTHFIETFNYPWCVFDVSTRRWAKLVIVSLTNAMDPISCSRIRIRAHDVVSWKQPILDWACGGSFPHWDISRSSYGRDSADCQMAQ